MLYFKLFSSIFSIVNAFEVPKNISLNILFKVDGLIGFCKNISIPTCEAKFTKLSCLK